MSTISPAMRAQLKSAATPAQESPVAIKSGGPVQSSASNHRSGVVLRLLDSSARQQFTNAIATSADTVTPSTGKTDELVAAFTQRFAASAQDSKAFHTLLRESFGDTYDQQAGEALRQQALAGDFSWLPSIVVVDSSVLADQSGTQGAGSGLGAYDAANDRIILSRDLLNDDFSAALDILTEEVGHALDTRLNTSDTAGDEGAVFARLSAGDALNASELSALRSENDSGTITIDGQQVEVEYGWLSDRWDDIKDAASSVADTVTDAIGSAADAVSDGISSIGNAISDGVQWVGDTIGDGVDFVYEYAIQPVLENTGPIGQFLDDHVVGPSVGLINDGIDIATNLVDSAVDTTTHFLSNNVNTVGSLLQGDWSGAWNNFVQTGSDLLSDTVGATVETFALGLHATSSFLNGTFGLSETRGLNAQERQYLETIFGDSLDYSEIRIQQGGIEKLIGMDPHAVGSDIYLPDYNFNADGTLTQAGLELLSHEAAHAWQFQNDGADYLSAALGSYVVDRPGAYDYGTELQNLTPWDELTPDHQAEFAMLIGMAQATDGVGPITEDGINNAIAAERFRTGDTVFPRLSPEQFAYMQSIQQRLLAGDA